MGARRGPERVHEHAKGERVQQSEAGEVELQHACIAHGDHAADEEDEEEGPYALGRVGCHAARFDGRLI